MSITTLSSRSVRVGDLLLTRHHTYVFVTSSDDEGWALASGYYIDIVLPGWLWISGVYTQGTLYDDRETVIR